MKPIMRLVWILQFTTSSNFSTFLYGRHFFFDIFIIRYFFFCLFSFGIFFSIFLAFDIFSFRSFFFDIFFSTFLVSTFFLSVFFIPFAKTLNHQLRFKSIILVKLSFVLLYTLARTHAYNIEFLTKKMRWLTEDYRSISMQVHEALKIFLGVLYLLN
jgi:hypothetical protein